MFYLTNLFFYTFIIRKDTHFYIKIAFEGEKLPCGYNISRMFRGIITERPPVDGRFFTLLTIESFGKLCYI